MDFIKYFTDFQDLFISFQILKSIKWMTLLQIALDISYFSKYSLLCEFNFLHWKQTPGKCKKPWIKIHGHFVVNSLPFYIGVNRGCNGCTMHAQVGSMLHRRTFTHRLTWSPKCFREFALRTWASLFNKDLTGRLWSATCNCTRWTRKTEHCSKFTAICVSVCLRAITLTTRVQYDFLRGHHCSERTGTAATVACPARHSCYRFLRSAVKECSCSARHTHSAEPRARARSPGLSSEWAPRSAGQTKQNVSNGYLWHESAPAACAARYEVAASSDRLFFLSSGTWPASGWPVLISRSSDGVAVFRNGCCCPE